MTSQGAGIPNISGLPFSATNNLGGETPGTLAQAQPIDVASSHPFIRTVPNGNFAHLGKYGNDGATTLSSVANSINTGYLIGNITYIV